MKKLLSFLCVLSLLGLLSFCVIVNPVMAQQKSQKEIERDLLISNLTALRNQELRVAILQQLVNEEAAKLRQMQAVFSDQYNLQPDKLRAGQYVYDEKTGKFVERKITGAETE